MESRFLIIQNCLSADSHHLAPIFFSCLAASVLPPQSELGDTLLELKGLLLPLLDLDPDLDLEPDLDFDLDLLGIYKQ